MHETDTQQSQNTGARSRETEHTGANNNRTTQETAQRSKQQPRTKESEEHHKLKGPNNNPRT